ncbi:type I-E CRISPR-associated protein Cas6/Cse3/CasE [Streptomyces noursei]
MPYLSRIPINPLRFGARKLLDSPQNMHAAIEGGVAHQDNAGRNLWRLDPDTPHRLHLWALTQVKPDWTHITEQAGWPNADTQAVTADYTPLLKRLAAGQEYAFRLTASPTYRSATPNNPTPSQKRRIEEAEKAGKRPPTFRLGHRTIEQQLQWLTDKAPHCGFEIREAPAPTEAPGILPLIEEEAAAKTLQDVTVASQEHHVFRKVNMEARTAMTVTINTATYTGTLRVTDPIALGRALITGIGSGKGYGCGLLTLANTSQVKATG